MSIVEVDTPNGPRGLPEQEAKQRWAEFYAAAFSGIHAYGRPNAGADPYGVASREADDALGVYALRWGRKP